MYFIYGPQRAGLVFRVGPTEFSFNLPSELEMLFTLCIG